MYEDRARKSSKSPESILGNAVGEMLRDLGHVMFCSTCKRAEMPGSIRCGRCGRPLERARSSFKVSVAVEAS